MLSFNHVSLAINGNMVLQNITFELQEGQAMVLVGASGAGKSSVFKLLTGEYRPTSGDIFLSDWQLSRLSPRALQEYRRQIGIIFQDFRLLPQHTVKENVALALRVCGESKNIDQRVAEALEIVGLQQKQSLYPYQLSGGEAQRTAIARALIHQPKLLIADEPTGNLDPKNSRAIGKLLHKVNKEQGMTLMIATHDPVLAGDLQPRILRLAEGEIMLDSPEYNPLEAFAGII